MYMRSVCRRGWFSRGRRVDMHNVLEQHFWSLTHLRIGRHLLGLDYAGNVIFYPNYRKKGFGGWTAVTLGAPGTSPSAFLSSDLSAVNVLEDGHPMHYRASQKLQAFVSEERRRWQLLKSKEEAARAAAAVAKAEQVHLESQATGTTTAGGKEAAKSTTAATTTTTTTAAAAAATKKPKEDATYNVELPEDATTAYYDNEQQFRDMLAIKCSHPRFFTRQLRISRLATFSYKCLYYYLWAVLLSLIVQGYLLFRSWVNPPARAGLRNIEEHVLHIPRLLFAGCVYGIAWLVRGAQPVIDPVINWLGKMFPQVNWDVASAERLASRAEHLADDARPPASASGHGAAKKAKLELAQPVAVPSREEQRAWWTNVLVVLLAIFSLLCIL